MCILNSLLICILYELRAHHSYRSNLTSRPWASVEYFHQRFLFQPTKNLPWRERQTNFPPYRSSKCVLMKEINRGSHYVRRSFSIWVPKSVSVPWGEETRERKSPNHLFNPHLVSPILMHMGVSARAFDTGETVLRTLHIQGLLW